MNDVPRVKVFHPQSHLVYQSDLLGSLARRSLEVIDNVPVAHYLSVLISTGERGDILYGEMSIQGGGPVALDAP